MKIALFCHDKQWFKDAAALFVDGVRKHRAVTIAEESSRPPRADLVLVSGLGFRPGPWRRGAHKLPTVYLDRGFLRTNPDFKAGDFARLTPSDMPYELGSWQMPDDRRKRFKWEPEDWRVSSPDDPICMAWSAAASHAYLNLPSPEQHALEIIARLRKVTQRPIIFRAKANTHYRDLPGVVLAGEKEAPIEQVLKGLHALVVTNSSVCLDGMLQGIPSVVLGEAPSKAISSTRPEEIEFLRCASLPARLAVLNDVAYCQWGLEELASGVAWEGLQRTRRICVF